jgi:hypothetical protein
MRCDAWLPPARWCGGCGAWGNVMGKITTAGTPPSDIRADLCGGMLLEGNRVLKWVYVAMV